VVSRQIPVCPRPRRPPNARECPAISCRLILIVRTPDRRFPHLLNQNLRFLNLFVCNRFKLMSLKNRSNKQSTPIFNLYPCHQSAGHRARNWLPGYLSMATKLQPWQRAYVMMTIRRTSWQQNSNTMVSTPTFLY
jgi:hypothetical protein